jgi:myo-inositol-1(or 4)-monophosphatase
MSETSSLQGISTTELCEIEESAVGFARQAGKILFKYFGLPGVASNELEVRYKDTSNRDPVTSADTEVQEWLSRQITDCYPSHSVVGEEDEDKTQKTLSETVWVLDPLDGTRNFLNGFPVFASSIGILHRGEFIGGAVFIPWPGNKEGIVVHASKNQGAKIDGVAFKMPRKKDHDSSGIMTLPGSFANFFKFEDGFARKSGELRMAGSISFELIMVALGITEYAVIGGAHLWDIAGAIPIIKEAGGGIRKHTKQSFGSRLIGVSEHWESFSTLVSSSTSGDYNFSEFRKYTPQLLVAHEQIIDGISSKITPKDVGFRGVAGGVFKK